MAGGPPLPELFPALGLDTAAGVRINFGMRPFKFDLSMLPATPGDRTLILQQSSPEIADLLRTKR